MSETIADIIEEKRSDAHYIRENYDTMIGRMNALKLEEEADRIEAAHKREMAAKDAEIAELHNMIEELTDALHPFREWFGNQQLIDRAKEMIGLKENGDMT